MVGNVPGALVQAEGRGEGGGAHLCGGARGVWSQCRMDGQACECDSLQLCSVEGEKQQTHLEAAGKAHPACA